jgi:hypothetical protein
VGAGILRRKLATGGHVPARHGNGDLSSEELKQWTSVVAKSLLYRANPDFDSPLGQSGMALYTEEKGQDGVAIPAVLGFQSFVQSSGRSVWEVEGDDLERRLEMGLVSFYGAFKAPKDLRRDFDIL